MKLIDILVEELPKRGGWLRDVKTMTQDRIGNIWGYDCVSPRLKGGLWSSKSGDDLVRDSKIEARNLAVDWNTAIITREQYEVALAAKNEGWIDWPGGECPVEKGTLVDVRLRNGNTFERLAALVESRATLPFWRSDDAGGDIIAYRLHQPQEAEQVRAIAWDAYTGITKSDDEADLDECIGQTPAPVWNGEGLPPVGMEIEYRFAKANYRTDFSRGKVLAYGMQNVFMEHWASKNEFIHPLDKIEFRPFRSEADRKREEAIAKITDAICGEIPDTGMATAAKYAARAYDAIAAGKIPGLRLED